MSNTLAALVGFIIIHAELRNYQTDSFQLSTMLHVVILLLSRSKKGDHGTSFESDREGGAESLWNSFFQ